VVRLVPFVAVAQERRAQHLAERLVRSHRPERPALAPQHERLRGQRRRELLAQARLADARLARDGEQAARARAYPLVAAREDLALRAASDELGGAQRGSRPSSRRRARDGPRTARPAAEPQLA
jgi:hypothetical protein